MGLQPGNWHKRFRQLKLDIRSDTTPWCAWTRLPWSSSMRILPTDASVMTHHPALAIRESATVQLTGLILIVAACPVITAMAGSLETLLLAHAVSLLAGGLLLLETRTEHQARSEDVK